MKPLNTSYEDFDFKSVAKRDKKRVKKNNHTVTNMFGLALNDMKNTIYFYKTKAKRHKVYLALKKFYPNIEKLPDNTNEGDLL